MTDTKLKLTLLHLPFLQFVTYIALGVYFGARPVLQINPLVSIPLPYCVECTLVLIVIIILLLDFVASVVVHFVGGDQYLSLVRFVCDGRHDKTRLAKRFAHCVQLYQFPVNDSAH